MGLKDEWIDKINGVDIASADDINQVAHAIIKLEETGIRVEINPIENGYRVTITDINGDHTFEVFNGEDAYTPQKGIDYWNEKDVQEIHSYVDAQISPLMQEINGVEEELRMINEGGVE